MSDWRPLDWEDGIATYHKYDHDSKKTLIKTSDWNVDAILKSNARKRNDADKGWKGEMHHVASIPRSIWDQWWKEFGGNPMSKENQPRLIAKLNSEEWGKLRTKEGNL